MTGGNTARRGSASGGFSSLSFHFTEGRFDPGLAPIHERMSVAMKKRKKIFAFLDKYSLSEEPITVSIKGSNTGEVLYTGGLWDVPFKFCTDYVLSYKYVYGYLEIVSTYLPYEK